MDDPILALALSDVSGSMVDRIERTLSDAIRSGVLPGGHRLREIPIADRFACSTTPVREAIRRLAAAGLAEVLPRRGAIVRATTEEGIRELYDFRGLVEPIMAARAAQAAVRDPDAVNELADLVERQEHQAVSGDLGDGRLDASFHAAVSRLAGNVFVAEQVMHVTQRIEAVQARANRWAPGGTESAHRFHAELLDAIRSGAADRAADIMREHLAAAERGVFAGLEGEGQRPPQSVTSA